MLVRTVADRHDHDVTLVALYRFEVLDDEPVETVLGAAVVQVRATQPGLLDGLVDGRCLGLGLGLGEGDGPKSAARAGVEVVDDPLGDQFRLYAVVPAATSVAIGTPLGLIVARVKAVRAAIGPILSGLQS
ncbi:hypothetical protein AB0D04_30790, partial [Streptomyces sp. NPDC048483]